MKDLQVENMDHTEVDWSNLTEIQQFYYGKNVFITGVTGTVGRTLLEKLIRCCPGIATFYVLMRPKKGLSVDERLDNLFKVELFDRAKEKVPNIKKNIHIIFGDLELPGLGISETDLEELRNNVQIAFHSAARVRWADPLRIAAEHNVLGTRQVLQLVKQFKKLEVFIYVSTAFLHRDPDLTIPERIVKTRMSPSQFMDALEWLDDEALRQIEPRIVREKNNTYLFTKALAENVILEENGSLPTAIVRPGIILPVYKEPIAGYCDTIQGPQGAFIAAAKGFLRTLYSFKGLKINIVPCDTVINTLVATAWYIGTNRRDDIFVVNCLLDYEKLPDADEKMLKEVMKKRDKYPLVNMYRYPDFTVYYTPLFYHIHAFFDHYIPAVIGDTFLFIFTGKPIMLQLYNRITYMFGEFVALGKEPWIGRKENYNTVMNCMSKKDGEIFFMNMDGMDWLQYIDDMLIVGRRVIAKEDPSNIPYAKKKAKVWWFVTTFIKWCLILYFFYYLLTTFFPDSEFSTFMKQSSQSSFVTHSDF